MDQHKTLAVNMRKKVKKAFLVVKIWEKPTVLAEERGAKMVNCRGEQCLPMDGG